MIVLKNKAEITISYPIEQIANKEKVLFFDIETTGFSRKYCHIYLIGCLYFIDDTPMYTQWFAENKNDEANILMAFYQFMKKYDTIIHFNGNSFDIPFVKARGEKYHLDFDFERFETLDIYQSVSKINHIFQMENHKQKSFEELLGIYRADQFNGGDLVEVYGEYLRTKKEALLMPLLLHNKEDVWNMALLLSLLAISDLFCEKYTVNNYNICQFNSLDNESKRELTIYLTLPVSIPLQLSYHYDGIYLLAKDNKVKLTIPIINTTLKLFFENYKDYYYLPMEDCAMHKSIASFVDPKHRKPATSATCFEKVSSNFIPIYDGVFEGNKTFRLEHSDKKRYIQLDTLNDDNIFKYVSIILKYLQEKPKR